MTMLGPVTATPATGGDSASALGGLDSDAFLKLLVAQLRYQNPLEPTDPTSMLQQTAMFTQVETLQQVSSAQQRLLGMTEAAMATDLVGQEVSALGPDDQIVTGTVDSVRFTPQGPMLSIGDRQVPMAGITHIGAADPVPTAEAPMTVGQAGASASAATPITDTTTTT